MAIQLMLRQTLNKLTSTAALIRRALRIAWEAAPVYTITSIALTIVDAAGPALQAWVLKLLLDEVVSSARHGNGLSIGSHLATILIMQLGIWVVCGTAAQLLECVQDLLSMKVSQHTQQLMLKKNTTLDLAAFENHEIYNQMSLAASKGAWQPPVVVRSLLAVAKSALVAISLMAMLCHLNPWILPLLIAAVLPTALVGARISRSRFGMAMHLTPEQRTSSYLSTLLSTRDCAQEMMAFRLGARLLERHTSICRSIFKQNRLFEVSRLRGQLVASTISVLGAAGAAALAAAMTSGGRITAGDLAMYFRAADGARGALGSLLTQGVFLYESTLFLKNLFGFLDIRNEEIPGGICRTRATPHVTQEKWCETPPRIELEDVCFTYPGTSQAVLRNLSLCIDSGERLALVGENGSGKTTLIKLLLRFYDPTSGVIRVNGVDLTNIDPDEWRVHCAPMFQNYWSYQFTALENVSLADVTSAEEKARALSALENVGIWPRISELPLREQTQLGRMFEDGVDLSVGEWQRLALARTWYKENTKFLVLDEPTASLDPQAEHDVLEAYLRLAAGKTTILVSHRLSASRLADKIAVLHKGELVEYGSHDQLILSDSRYSHLYNIQAQRYTVGVSVQPRENC